MCHIISHHELQRSGNEDPEDGAMHQGIRQSDVPNCLPSLLCVLSPDIFATVAVPVLVTDEACLPCFTLSPKAVVLELLASAS